jgi:uncharacterized protein YkwD
VTQRHWIEENLMFAHKKLASSLIFSAICFAAFPVAAGQNGSKETTASIAARPAAINAQAVLRSVNAYRASQGLEPVQLDAKVMAAAVAHSQAMAASNSMSHSAGGSFSSRMAEHGINRGKAVENIAMGQRSFEEVFAAWKGSYGHDANLRASGVTKLGVGAAHGPSGVAWTLILVGDSSW